MKKTLRQAMTALGGLSFIAFGAAAQVPSGYYDSLEGLHGAALKKAVKELVADHEVVHYGDTDPGNSFHPVTVATWQVFQESDTRTVDGHLCWWDMYSANNMWVSDGHPGLNIEHSVANSWWGGKAGSTEAYNDLHHLNPSNGDANNAKSNWPLGEIAGNPYWTNGVTTTGTPKSGLGDGATRVFDPYPSYRGDFARAYFYIFTVYDAIEWKDDYAWMYDAGSDLTLKEWAYTLLLRWADEDPVSEKETVRNEAVYTYQKNRNPFIDCPQLARHIWGDLQDHPFHYELYTPDEDNPEVYPGWDEEFSDLVPGRWKAVSSDDELSENYEYHLIAPLKRRAMTYTLLRTAKALEECAFSPEFDDTSGGTVVTGVPEDIATVRLEKGDGGWHVAVYAPDDSFIGFISVTAKNTANVKLTKGSDTMAKISIDGAANKAVITYDLNGTDYTLQYNAQNPRFAAYTSSQSPVQLYREAENDGPQTGVGAVEAPEETVTAIYDINGRRIDATSTAGLDRGIYIIVTTNGTRKIRK